MPTLHIALLYGDNDSSSSSAMPGDMWTDLFLTFSNRARFGHPPVGVTSRLCNSWGV